MLQMDDETSRNLLTHGVSRDQNSIASSSKSVTAH
jgi:hypothetical protein